MGGIGGFTALADGIDRALAGLEPGFEPQRVYGALEEHHGSLGRKKHRDRNPSTKRGHWGVWTSTFHADWVKMSQVLVSVLQMISRL